MAESCKELKAGKHHVRLEWKLFAVTNTLACYGFELITAVKSFIVLGPYSQHFIFFITYEWAQ
jgi:hypothetical protein